MPKHVHNLHINVYNFIFADACTMVTWGYHQQSVPLTSFVNTSLTRKPMLGIKRKISNYCTKILNANWNKNPN